MSEDVTNVPAVAERPIGRDIEVSTIAGGLTFANMAEVVDFAKLMCRSGVAVPKHLRENPGACLAVTIQAVEWRMSPFAVANKSYSVNDRLAYESQLVQAVVLSRAPILGRFSFRFDGEGPTRQCTVSAILKDTEETVTYTTPMVKDIKVKNSPLWQADPDQQLTYYAGRALSRRYFPDVLLGVYTEDELRDTTPAQPQRINPLLDDVEGTAVEVAALEVSPDSAAHPSGETTALPTVDPVSPETILPTNIVRGATAEYAMADEIVTQDGTRIKTPHEQSRERMARGSRRVAEKRHTFTVPDDYEALRDDQGRATGQLRHKTTGEIIQGVVR